MSFGENAVFGGIRMRREFMVERQGRQFVLYAGLLALGHEQGLKSIHTQLIQIPTESNHRVAIVSATVILERDGVQKEFHGIGDAAPNNVASAMINCLIRLAETRAKARALRDAVNVGMAALEELGDDDVFEGAPERGYAVTSGRSGRGIASRAIAATRSSVNSNGFEKNGNTRSASGNIARESAPTPRVVTSVPAEPELTVANQRNKMHGDKMHGEVKNTLDNPVTDAQLDAIRSLCRRRNLDGEATARERFAVNALNSLTQAQASDLIKVLQVENSSSRTISHAA